VRYILTSLFVISSSVFGQTQVMNGVDDGTAHINLGHAFPYYGGVFTDAWMSSNGFIILYDPTTGYGNSNTRQSWCNTCPWGYSGGPPEGRSNLSFMIAPLWTDLEHDTSVEGSGYFYETASTGTQFLWNKVKEYNTNNLNTFGVELWPDGSFDFHYDEVKITNHSTWIGFTGDTTSQSNNVYDEVKELFYKTRQEGGMTTDHIANFASESYETDGNTYYAWYGQDGGYEGNQTTTEEEQTTSDLLVEDLTGQDFVYGDDIQDFYFQEEEMFVVQEANYEQEQEFGYGVVYEQEQEFGYDVVFEPEGNTGNTGMDERSSEEERNVPMQELPEIQTTPVLSERTDEVYSRPDDEQQNERVETLERPEENNNNLVREEIEPVEEIEIDLPTRANPTVNAVAIALEQVSEAEKLVFSNISAITTTETNSSIQTKTKTETNSSKQAITKTETNSSIQNDTNQINTEERVFLAETAFFEKSTFNAVVDPTVTVFIEQTAEQTTEFVSETSDAQNGSGFDGQQNESFSTGQSITAILNNVQPNYSQFDVAPPSASEVSQEQRAESQAQNMSEEQLASNLDEFTEEMQDSGGFNDQSLTIFLMGRVSGFENYGGSLQDNPFYSIKGMPINNVPNDRNIMLQLIGTSGKHEQMVAEQYE